MIFHYLKRKDGAIVVADYDSNEEGTWVTLSYGSNNTEQPYFSTLEMLDKIVAGKFNDDWGFEIPKRMQEDFEKGLVEIKSVEL